MQKPKRPNHLSKYYGPVSFFIVADRLIFKNVGFALGWLFVAGRNFSNKLSDRSYRKKFFRKVFRKKEV